MSVEAFRDAARDLLSRADQRARLRMLRTDAVGFDRAVWQQLCEAGWLSVTVPEADDGLGLGLRELCAIGEEVGRHLLPEPFIAAGVLPIALLARLPSEPIRDRWLARMLAGDTIAGVIDPSASRYGAAGVDGWFVVGADDALSWVDAKAPGIQCATINRIDGTLLVTLPLKSTTSMTPIARGASVRQAMNEATDIARIAQGAELLGIARRAIDITLEHLRTRKQFGVAIGSFQALQHRMVDAYIQSELAAVSLEDSIAAYERGHASLAACASRVKARCTRAAIQVTRLAIQMHGAMGYTDEHDIGLYFKRALGLASWLGNETEHRRRYFDHQPGESKRELPAYTRTDFPRVADWEAMPEVDFRALVRAFFERHYPAHLRHQPHRVHWDVIRPWYLTLARQGWIAPAWPTQFGGMALPPDKLIAFIEEQEHYGVARPPDQGLIMLGPLLIRFGTPAQQAHYLPKILSGEHVWCQGYSEPNAGSDLASLRTEALVEGDTLIVTGQKTWSTLAQDATHMFMLVRTAKTGKKQEGISFLLVDLASPGVTVRPIRNVAGDEEFCEVFFDQVRVPIENIVGELHQGWNLAKALLGFERLFGGSPKHAQYALGQLDIVASARGLFDDAAFVSRYAEALLDTADLSAAYAHFAAIVKRGEPLPANVSILKIWATETHERIAMLLAEAAAEQGGDAGVAQFDGTDVHVLAPWLNALAATIFSGSNEIQRNILATQVLGLPRG